MLQPDARVPEQMELALLGEQLQQLEPLASALALPLAF